MSRFGCWRRFMNEPMEIYVDDEAKLTLHGLVQARCAACTSHPLTGNKHCGAPHQLC